MKLMKLARSGALDPREWDLTSSLTSPREYNTSTRSRTPLWLDSSGLRKRWVHVSRTCVEWATKEVSALGGQDFIKGGQMGLPSVAV